MNFDIPDTWTALELGQVLDYGKTRKAEPDEIPDDAWLLELEDVEKDTSKVLQRLTFAERKSKSTKNRFEKGDVLYGKLRPYLNKVVLADEPGFCTTEIIPIPGNTVVNSRFLFHWLRHPAFLDYVSSVSHGLSMPRLGTEAGNKAPFVLAPVAEQERIANKLDTVLARVDAVNDRLARVAPLLKRLRQSVLAAATSGRLTADWEEHQEFQMMELGEVAAWGSGGTPSRSDPKNFGGHIPWIKTGELQEQVITSSEEHITQKGLDSSSAKLFPPRTVLVAMYGATVGRVAMLGIHAATNQACAAAICRHDVMLPEFLFYLLQNEKQSLVNQAQGGAQPNISQTLIKKQEVSVPLLGEQTEIVRRVELLFAYADRLEARLQAAQTAAQRLTPALLAKAFRGELVPQDPNDEPAAELLRRLKEGSSGPAAQAKAGRKSGKKAT